jgi:hypothetical protein
MKAKMTLKKAKSLADTGKSKNLARAANIMTGCPRGGWAETAQAKTRLADLLPTDRSFSRQQWLEEMYVLDHAERYQPKP